MKSLAGCLWIILLLVNSPALAQPVVFNDANLKARVEVELGLDNPTADDMLGLTSLSAANLKIRDLTGLETARNVQTLYLYNNQISDLSPLSGMTNLDTLALHNNQISDISALSRLTNLTQLSLGNNQISDIAILSNMSGLRNLSLNHNQVNDLSALSALTELLIIEAKDNQINDISMLAGLSNLAWIDLERNLIQDIAGLIPLTRLQYLDVRDNPLYTTACEVLLPQIAANHPNAEIYFDECTHLPPDQPDPPDPPDPVQYTLILSSSTGGSIIIPGEGVYGPCAEGTVVSVQAEAEEGFIFSYWTGTAVTGGMVSASNLAETTVILQGDVTLQANFIKEMLPPPPDPPDPVQYTLTLSSGLGGSVTVPGEGVHGPYTAGTLLTVQATAEPGHVFGYWAGTAVDAGMVSTVDQAITMVTLLDDYTLAANFIEVKAVTLYVDDDGPGDPAPDHALISDPQENGTSNHPFDRIQEAIDAADNGVIIRISPGMYRENIDFQGKSISIIGLDPNDPNTSKLPIIYGAQSGPVVHFSGGQGPGCLLMGVAISGGQGDTLGAIACHNSYPTIAHCLITGNRSLNPYGAPILCVDSNVVFSQCTIAHNVGGAQGAGMIVQDSDVFIRDSILWSNLPEQIQLVGESLIHVQYSNVQGSFSGQGNLDVDPVFVQPGYWAHINNMSLRLEPDDPLGQWIMGDYHLQAQTGRWHNMTQSWIADANTSACIDAGDPSKPVGHEQPPHGDRVNMGVYGGTIVASQSFVPEDDGLVHFQDDILKSKVQETLGIWWDPTPEDMLNLSPSFIATHSLIQDISGLNYAENLQALILRWNLIKDISYLAGLTQLLHLDLSQNDVSDLYPLSGLVNLKYLDLHWNQVEDLSALSQLTNLRVLILRNNRIADISALTGLNALEELALNSNHRIRDISPLSGMTNLISLSLQFNEIHDLLPLSGLAQLEELNLKKNNIADISPISQFSNLKILNLQDNPLNRTAYSNHLDKIIDNNPGIDLRYDPNPY